MHLWTAVGGRRRSEHGSRPGGDEVDWRGGSPRTWLKLGGERPDSLPTAHKTSYVNRHLRAISSAARLAAEGQLPAS